MNSTDSHQLSKGNIMSKYIPEIGTIVIPETVKEKTVEGILNRLAPGTPIRATLGDTVIVGVVGTMDTKFGVIPVTVDGFEGDIYGHLRANFMLWVQSGWEFEVLGEVVTS